ncbi:MAG TPA: DUF1080 domain-containing protein [Flavitalea sp.]|nr:DUF1080 domain-containing protein [Flavitalea sp.]
MNNAPGTKFSSVILLFSLLTVVSCVAKAPQGKGLFKNMFDGKTLKGWRGDTTIWKVQGNTIKGQTTADHPIKSNTFLIYEKEQPGDFELVADFKISASGNSGIQYRSVTIDTLPYTLKGYQADIDGNNVYTGQNYEERGRGFLAKRGEIAVLDKEKQPQITSMIADPDSLKSFIKTEDWNEIRILAEGNRMRHFINGHLMSDVTDNDESLRKMKGIIGFQVHAGPPMKVEYRNIRIKN